MKLDPHFVFTSKDQTEDNGTTFSKIYNSSSTKIYVKWQGDADRYGVTGMTVPNMSIENLLNTSTNRRGLLVTTSTSYPDGDANIELTLTLPETEQYNGAELTVIYRRVPSQLLRNYSNTFIG